MRRSRTFLLLAAFMAMVPARAFCDEPSTEPEPYEADEFPQWAQDARRFEIITFGSLPFTWLGTSLAYGGIMYATGSLPSFPNPFDKTAATLSEKDQFAVLGIAAGISVGIGTADLIITLVRRSKAHKALVAEEERSGQVVVTPEEAGELLRSSGNRAGTSGEED